MAMVALYRRRNPRLASLPAFLTHGCVGFRTICGGCLEPVSSPSDVEVTMAGKKILETFTEEFQVGSRTVKFETGKIARFANGSVVMGMEDTRVLSTVTSAKGDGVRDFLPLSVEYQEKQYAQGVIPTTFMRREGAPRERELICGRLIDRPIRPLFPYGFYHEVQVIASVLSSDGKQDPDVMAANASSAALMLSDIPWQGPIGVIRIGRIDGQFIVNPTMDELSLSDLNLVYACTMDKTLMIDVQAREISEKDLEAGLRIAHPEAVKFIEPQVRLAAKAGKTKREYKLSMISDGTLEKIRNLAESSIERVFTDPAYGKFERGEALDRITQGLRSVLEEEGDEDSLRVLSKAVDAVRKQVVRGRILKEGRRVDGRQLDEIRPLYCEAGYLSRLHGSSLFSRGDTQVLCTVTLGAPADAQKLDALVGPPTKRFMLHYSFPPFSTNEVGKRMGLNRREVGHGTLAEKALLAVLPPEDDLPFTVRVNSEVMASDGSTSMATVCGGSMALLDAGIPLKAHVAGVSVGLISEVDPSTGLVSNYKILTDILGLEDHLGDMDFKVAGTRGGITAIQLDIKPGGIPLDIICECLEPALKGRLQILDHLEKEINAPRPQENRNSPRIVNINTGNDSIRRLWPYRKRIEEETGARISANDGVITIMAKDQDIMDKALEKVYFIVGREIEVGGICKGVVTSIKEFGAFVEFNGGQQGLLHISELSHEPVSRVTDVVSLGQVLSLMCIEKDVRGNISLSLKATKPLPEIEKESSSASILTVHSTDPSPVTESSSISHQQMDPDSSLSQNINDDIGYSSPSVVVRSAAECDAPDSSTQSCTSKRRKTLKSSSSKPPVIKGLDGQDGSKQPQTSTAEYISRSRARPTSERNRASAALTWNRANAPLAKKLEEDQEICSEIKAAETPKSMSHGSGMIKAVTTSLKIGDKMTAKVYQIRAHGLVLELGRGRHGMYRFEAHGRREFDVGEKLRVVCSSFSSKGIPVMSVLEDE